MKQIIARGSQLVTRPSPLPSPTGVVAAARGSVFGALGRGSCRSSIGVIRVTSLWSPLVQRDVVVRHREDRRVDGGRVDGADALAVEGFPVVHVALLLELAAGVVEEGSFK